ncbi:hypothetical protein CASFOL_024392 [Castilleja foliolosa]|uniref:Pectinesterase inhibitor domain-containing protein n=1 Tax=Castilleja foliolosa TaxID=1961234 RepID=A0ABD3CN68_9LAMI
MDSSLMLTTTISVMWLVVGAAAAANELIINTCNCTQYQELCRQSLAPYARLLSNKPSHLAYVAVRVTMKDAKNVFGYVQELKANYTNIAGGALEDCAENLDGLVDQIRDSLKETRWLFAANKPSQGVDDFHFHVSNVQTWMSAALTDEDTCADELQYLDEPLIRSYVANRISRVQGLLSNALALINTYYGNI